VLEEARRARQPEVRDPHPAVVAHEHVLGLEVAVNDARGVRGGDAPAGVDEEVSHLAPRARRRAQPCPKRAATDELHREEHLVAKGPGVMHLNHVGVRKPRHGLRLPQEPRGEGVRRPHMRGVRPQELQRHLPIQLGVIGAVDDTHSARADDVEDDVTADAGARWEEEGGGRGESTGGDARWVRGRGTNRFGDEGAALGAVGDVRESTGAVAVGEASHDEAENDVMPQAVILHGWTRNVPILLRFAVEAKQRRAHPVPTHPCSGCPISQLVRSSNMRARTRRSGGRASCGGTRGSYAASRPGAEPPLPPKGTKGPPHDVAAARPCNHKGPANGGIVMRKTVVLAAVVWMGCQGVPEVQPHPVGDLGSIVQQAAPAQSTVNAKVINTASDWAAPVPVEQSGAWNVYAAQRGIWEVGVTGGSVNVSSMPPLTFQEGASVNVERIHSLQPVIVSNLPDIQWVNGMVTVTNLPDTLQVAGTVAISNLPATQPVSGTVAVSNFPATQSIAGSVSLAPGAQVTVNNDASAPLPVRNVDNPTRHPAQTAPYILSIGAGADSMQQGLVTVPAGRRLTIEYAAARISCPAGQKILGLSLSAVGPQVEGGLATGSVELIPTYLGQRASNNTDVFSSSQKVLLYADPGEQVFVGAQRDQNTGICFGGLTLSGYTVAVP
jgi:hypothetical protein